MFSIQESLKYGWEKFWGNKSIWVGTLAMGLLALFSGMKGGFGIISIFATIALIIAEVGYNKLLLRIADGESFTWSEGLKVIFNTHKVFWKYLGTKILFSIIAVIGFILLIVPGFFVVTTFIFASLVVVDTGLGPIAALKESREITRGSRLKILGLIFVIIFLNILGALLFSIGLLVSIPVSMLTLVHAYRKLLALKTSPAVVA